MIIMNKDRDSMLSSDKIFCLYLGEDRRTIKAVVGDTGKIYRLGTYQSEATAMAALEKIYGYFGKVEACYMPTEEEAEMLCRSRDARPDRFSKNGKKPVRHGGS